MLKKARKVLEKKAKGLDKDEKAACLKILDECSDMITKDPEAWAAASYYTYLYLILQEMELKGLSRMFGTTPKAISSKHRKIMKKLKPVYFDRRFIPKHMTEKIAASLADEITKRIMEKETLTQKDYTEAQDKILKFIKKKYPREIRKADRGFQKYSRHLYDAGDVDDEKLATAFISYLVTVHSIGDRTPAEIFFEEKCRKPSKLQRVVRKMANPRAGFFEVVSRKDKIYFLEDIQGEEKMKLVTVNLDKPLPEGAVFFSILLPFNYFQWLSYGPISVWGRESWGKLKEDIKKDIAEKTEFIETMRKQFFEFFNSYDPEFPDWREALKALNEMFRHYNPDARGGGEEMEGDADRVGLVMTEAGITVVPYYGYLKDIICGRFRKVPDWKEMLDLVVRGNEFAADPVLRELVYSNKKTALKAFKETYPFITDFRGVERFLWEWRPHIMAKELPKVEKVDRPPPRKIGRNEPCPCGSGKKYKKCCLRKFEGRQHPD